MQVLFNIDRKVDVKLQRKVYESVGRLAGCSATTAKELKALLCQP
jgi:hypothetical protein